MNYGETYTFQYTISDDPDCLIQCTNTITVFPESECTSCEVTAEVGECKDGCYTVSLSGADNYIWQPSANVDDTDPNNPTICNTSGGIFQVFGFVDGEICGATFIELEACENPPVPTCEFSIGVACTTCGCGDPYGGARLYDADGNYLNISNFDMTVDWFVDGTYSSSNNNPKYLKYEGPYVLCAEINYNLPNGERCDTTMCVEVVCHGDCPTVNFATCEDLPFSEFEECGNYTSGDNCAYGSFYGYVWAVDAAGNPIQNFWIDWYNNGIAGQNPMLVNGWQGDQCGEMEVRVFRFWEPQCETIATFSTDCCNSTAPEISCQERSERGWNIFVNQICPNDLLVTINCFDWGGFSETIVVPAEDIQNGVFEIPNYFECNDMFISVQAICSDGEISESSNCIILDFDHNGCYELNENCDVFTGDGRSRGRSILSSLNIHWEDSNIVPNPGPSDEVIINIASSKYEHSKFINYEVVDINGKMIFTETISNSADKIQLNRTLESGLYFVNIRDKSNLIIESMKMIIAN